MGAHEALRAARDELLARRGEYDLAVSTFRWPQIDGPFNWAHDWFDVIARGNDRPGLVVADDRAATTYSFAELAVASDQLAHWLSGMGLTRGQSVIVMLGNQVQLWQTVLAVMKLGAVIVPTTTAAGASELADRVQRADARFVVCNPADASKLDAVPGHAVVVTTDRFPEALAAPATPVAHPQTAANDRLLLYFTSGTTSRPKLVEHTQVSYPVGHLSTMYWIGLQPGDVHLNISSPGWAKHAWSSLFAPWLAEATIMVYDYERFDGASLLRLLNRHRVTTFCAPPTVWRMLINADLSTGGGTLRELVSAGEPLNPEVIEQVRRAWGLTIRDGFGQTETTAQIANVPGAPVKVGSMGRPLPGIPVVLVNPLTGERSDREGEICIDLGGGHGLRPLALMTGYQGDQARDAAASAGGYYHTGDIATRDEDGYITFVGRTDDVFKASDYKISPFELESILIEHPAVAEAAVVPAPDPVRLAVPKAYVALAPGFEPTAETAFAILQHARARLAPYQRVRRIEFFELPKTISGKIRRVELRQREQDLAARGDSPAEFRAEQFPDLR